MIACADCIHFRVPTGVGLDIHEFARCAHPKVNAPRASLVTGTELPPLTTYCATQRAEYGRCGPKALLYEAPVSLEPDVLKDFLGVVSGNGSYGEQP